MDVFQLTYDSVHDGAVGVDMGRNIWQNDHPVAMIRAVRSIIHEGASVKEANDVFLSVKQGKKGSKK